MARVNCDSRGANEVRTPRKNFNKFALAVICKLRRDPATPNGIGIWRDGVACRASRAPLIGLRTLCRSTHPSSYLLTTTLRHRCYYLLI